MNDYKIEATTANNNIAPANTNILVNYYSRHNNGYFYPCRGLDTQNANKISKELLAKVSANMDCEIDLALNKNDFPFSVRVFTSISVDLLEEKAINQKGAFHVAADKPLYIMLKSLHQLGVDPELTLQLKQTATDNIVLTADLLACGHGYCSTAKKTEEITCYTRIDGERISGSLFRPLAQRYAPYAVAARKKARAEKDKSVNAYPPISANTPAPVTYTVQHIYNVQINNYTLVNNNNNNNKTAQTNVNFPQIDLTMLNFLADACAQVDKKPDVDLG